MTDHTPTQPRTTGPGQPQKYEAGPAVRITVTLDPSVADGIEQAAEEQREKRSTLVNRVLAAWLQRR